MSSVFGTVLVPVFHFLGPRLRLQIYAKVSAGGGFGCWRAHDAAILNMLPAFWSWVSSTMLWISTKKTDRGKGLISVEQHVTARPLQHWADPMCSSYNIQVVNIWWRMAKLNHRLMPKSSRHPQNNSDVVSNVHTTQWGLQQDVDVLQAEWAWMPPFLIASLHTVGLPKLTLAGSRYGWKSTSIKVHLNTRVSEVLWLMKVINVHLPGIWKQCNCLLERVTPAAWRLSAEKKQPHHVSQLPCEVWKHHNYKSWWWHEILDDPWIV